MRWGLLVLGVWLAIPAACAIGIMKHRKRVRADRGTWILSALIIAVAAFFVAPMSVPPVTDIGLDLV